MPSENQASNLAGPSEDQASNLAGPSADQASLTDEAGQAGQVRVYRPSKAYCAAPLTFATVMAVTGIGLAANYQHAGWPGLAGGAACLLGAALMIAMTLTASVTVHDQGVVIRQYLGRRFIPWQAVLLINDGGPTHSLATPPRDNRNGTPVVWLLVSKGVTYMEEWVRLDATRGGLARVRQIAAEMEEFRRRERESRGEAADSLPPSRLPPPVTPGLPDDGGIPPPIGKALW